MIAFFQKAALIALSLWVVSCTLKEEESASYGDVLYSFRAEIADDYLIDGARSSVTLSNGKSSFSAGDEVAVTLGSTIGIYRYDGSTFNLCPERHSPET